MRIHFGVLAAVISLVSFAAQGSEAKGTASATTAQTKKTTSLVKKTNKVRIAHKGHSRRGRGAYLIPPPPAYMPCILPELYYRNNGGTGVTEIAAVKKENPYKKYVSTPTGDAPEPLQSRKGVSTWSHRS